MAAVAEFLGIYLTFSGHSSKIVMHVRHNYVMFVVHCVSMKCHFSLQLISFLWLLGNTNYYSTSLKL
jgi:hypothetical protein